jgi:hypothetical protein
VVDVQGDEDDDGTDFLLKDTGDDLDLRLARLEELTVRRPELLSSVMLRQNPHNVAEWHKRVKLFDGNPRKQVGKSRWWSGRGRGGEGGAAGSGEMRVQGMRARKDGEKSGG